MRRFERRSWLPTRLREQLDQRGRGDARASAGLAPALLSGPALLASGVLAIRWALIVWMAILAVSGASALPPPEVRVVVWLLVVAVAAAHTAWRPGWSPLLLLVDLVVAVLVAVTGVRYPAFATVYPAMTALHWGAALGVGGGSIAGGLIGVVLFVARLQPSAIPQPPGFGVTVRAGADVVNLVLAGGGLGYVATLLRRSASSVRAAQDAELRARERAARLTERESLGRQIHDSVLQVLAMVHKRGRELGELDTVPATQVTQLAELAAAQERTLRALILRVPDEPAVDDRQVSLRTALEDAAAQVGGEVDIEVAAVGESSLPVHQVEQIRAAVEQALRNVVQHAQATRAWVFVDDEDTAVVVSVRDDGRGFVYDESQLRADGKYGLLRSICGRITELGGSTHVDTAPGRGTELQMRVPRPDDDTSAERSERAVRE